MTDPTQSASLRIGLPWDDYAAADAANFSSIKLLARTPAHYLHGLSVPRSDTAALRFGRAEHLAVLEPPRFATEVAMFAGERRAGAEWKRFEAEHDGQIILKAEEYEKCCALAAAVRANPDALRLLSGGHAEVSVTWRDEATGIVCKGRIDYLNDEAITDLKSTRDASPDGFSRQSWRYLYHAQAAMYQDAVKAATGRVLPFYDIAAEKDAPFISQVYRVPEFAIEAGREEYRGWLVRLAECRAANRWPGYADGVVELMPPRWALGTEDDENDVGGLGLEFDAA